MKSTYSEDSITVLKGLNTVRRRPVMYLGERGSNMLWRMLKEPVDNAGDEFQAGRNNYIEVFVDSKTDEYIVRDCAQGIPVGTHKTEKKSTLEVVMTTLHAGGKFDDKSYKFSCFVGSTKIRLLDGTVRTMKWLTENYWDRSFWVISSKEDGTIVPGLAYFPRKTKTVQKLIEVTLDNGKKEYCTLDHRWMLRDGTYKQAKNLKIGDSLMPMHYRVDEDGRLEFHPNTLNQPYLQEKKFERLKSNKFLKMHRAVYSFFHPDAYVYGNQVHHANLNPSDDRPENLVYLPKGDHGTLHYALGTSDDRSLVAYNKSEKGRKKSSRTGNKYSHLLTDYANSEEGKDRASKHMSNVNRSSKDLQQMGKIVRSYLHITKNLNLKFNRDTYTEYRSYGAVNYDHLNRYFKNLNDIKGYVLLWLKNRNRAGQSLKDILKSLNSSNRTKANACANNYNNHKVARIKILHAEDEPVYDITVNKYNNFLLDSGVFVHNSGTHGIGVSATNAVSTTLKVWTYRDGKCWHQEYSKGIPKADVKEGKVDVSVLRRLTNKSKQGTIIYYVPDQSVVAKETEKAIINKSQCLNWLRNFALLNTGLTIQVTFDGIPYTYVNKVGPERMMQLLEKKLGATRQGRTFIFEADNCTCAFAFSDYTDADGIKSYVCNSPTKSGGTHLKGFASAFTKALSKYVSKRDKFKASDLLGSLIGILHWRMSEPEFTSQIKDCLDSNVSKEVETLLTQPLDAFFAKNKKLARDIIKRAVQLTSSREQYKKVMKSISDVKRASNRSLLPTILASAVKAKPEDREIYLVEGDSAFGTAKQARDSNFQEVMKLKGKPINSMRENIERVLANEVIQNAIIALGVDTENTKKGGRQFSADGLRAANVYLLADPDEDGAHINLLMLAFFYKFMPDLIRQKRVHVIDAPLFHAFYKNKRYIGSTFEACHKQMPKGSPKQYVIRSKGWGEIDATTLGLIAFNPKSRSVITLDYPKTKELLARYESIVGKETEARKELLNL